MPHAWTGFFPLLCCCGFFVGALGAAVNSPAWSGLHKCGRSLSIARERSSGASLFVHSNGIFHHFKPKSHAPVRGLTCAGAAGSWVVRDTGGSQRGAASLGERQYALQFPYYQLNAEFTPNAIRTASLRGPPLSVGGEFWPKICSFKLATVAAFGRSYQLIFKAWSLHGAVPVLTVSHWQCMEDTGDVERSGLSISKSSTKTSVIMSSFRDSHSMMRISIYCTSSAWTTAAFSGTSLSVWPSYPNSQSCISTRKEKNKNNDKIRGCFYYCPFGK